MVRYGLALGALFVILVGCDGDPPPVDGNLILLVELKTDLVPAIEFAAVRTQLFDPADRADELTRRQIDVALGRDLTTGLRVAELGDLAVGTYLVRVTLVDLEDVEVLGRDVVVTVRETAGVTVLMTRDCVGVMCPATGSDPTEAACLGGRCVEERCTPETPEFCPLPECSAASECTETVSDCAEPTCEDGTCLLSANSTLCMPVEEYCDPTSGCRPLAMPPGDQDAYLKASNTETASHFGGSSSLSADGRTLAVGAWGESTGGVVEAGAVYVFAWDAGTWSQQAYLPAERAEAVARFGHSVSLSADGNTLAVGAWGEDGTAREAGAAYVFTRVGGTWSLEDRLEASNPGMFDLFGISVSLSGDGSRLAVGATGEASPAAGVDGNQSADTEPSAGAVYVFARGAGGWLQEVYLKASNTGTGDGFGTSVALDSDGSVLAVGAAYEDSEGTGVGGDGADDLVVQSGAVYLFTRTGISWDHEAYLKPSNTGSSDSFGTSLSLSGDGMALAVGAPGESSGATGGESDDSFSNAGAVYVFGRDSGAWLQEAFLKASNADAGDEFGTAVSLSADGSTLIAGAPGEASAAMGVDGDDGDNRAPGAGAAYEFVEASGTWSQAAYRKAPNTEANDEFGRSVSVTENGAWLAVGAPEEDSSAMGVDGDESDNEAAGSGAVYMFTR